jgi:cytochrome c peroxidase
LAALAPLVVGSPPAGPPAGAAEVKAPVKPSAVRTLRLPKTPYRYADIELPSHFRTAAARRFDNTPGNNPVTDAGATLGRVLFYDTRLSANNTTACASCHKQQNAFAAPQRFSKGHEGKLTDRHAPTVVNLRFNRRGRFFWDERAPTLEAQVLMPIQSRIELGNDLDRLVSALAADARYPGLFRDAFGDSKVTKDRIARALAQFLRSIVSCNSKFDEGMNQVLTVREDFPNFTAAENRGKRLFLARCATCHMPGGQAAHFFMDRPRNNGLDGTVRGTDGGVGDITLIAAQVGLFKSPSLRNVELTAPYMHDGRLKTLDEVIDHYSKGVKGHPNVDGRVRRRLNLRDADRAALAAFLRTLTDRVVIADPKYSDPFQ